MVISNHNVTTPLTVAKKLCSTGRYYYKNKMGRLHPVNIRKEGVCIFIIFDDNTELDRKLLEGTFYYRK